VFMHNLSDPPATKVALVTGGARRIGSEIVRCLHAAGMNIALHYLSSLDDARRLCDELNAIRPASVQLFEADLLDNCAIQEMVASVTAAFARMDVLVNNASRFFATPLGTVDDAAYQELLDINLKAPLFLAQAAAPQLEKTRGCIINITDIYGWQPLAGHPVYCAAKAGLIMLTRSLALELAPGIRVNAVAPGAILWPESGGDEIERAAVLAKTPMKRTGDPSDVAQAVLFLVGDAHYVTGQVIKVDGGRAIG
jgi:pteridine reductase